MDTPHVTIRYHVNHLGSVRFNHERLRSSITKGFEVESEQKCWGREATVISHIYIYIFVTDT